MKDDDDQLMYEAYVSSLMGEAPVGFGPSSDEPYEPEKTDTERLKKYSKGTLDSESLHIIVSRVKDFLNDQPNGIFPGDADDFKIEIKHIISDVSGEEGTKLNINSTNSGYAARVVRNSLNAKGVIDINAKEDKVEVQDVNDVDVEDAVEDGLEAGIEAGGEEVSPDKPDKFSRHTEYNVDPLAAETLPRQHREVAEYLPERDGYNGDEILDYVKTKMIFTNPAPAGGFDSNVPKLLKVLNDLVKAGILIPVKESEVEGSGKHGSTFDAADTESQAKADRDFIDRTVKQANWGHETPVMRPDDF